MQNENIKYVLVWSGWLRLSHWVLAFGVFFQITSAWAIRHDYANYEFWRDWHIMIGQLMLIALILRAILLFNAGAGNWRSFFKFKSQSKAILQTIMFYLSFTRMPLPNWYAHNPLWKPVYMFMFAVLSGCVVTGMAYDSNLILFGSSPAKIHGTLATIVIVTSVAHIVTAFLHDWKGKGAFISAIINGHRYFHQAPGDLAAKTKTVDTPAVQISVDSIENIKK